MSEKNMKLKLGNKTVTIRKWKGKDKKSLINALKSNENKEQSVINSLVYSCIEEDVILDVQETQYVLMHIRAISLGDHFNITLHCDECDTHSEHSCKISDKIRYSFIDKDVLQSGDVVVKIGNIKNKDFYLKKITEDSMYDLLLRVESFNGCDTFTLDELIEKFDDLDVDVLDDIINQWETTRFKVDDINEVECPNCHNKELYKFDAIPNFFPDSWIK